MLIDKKEFINKQKKQYITIGIAGCIERMGTTTQSMQLIQYLQLTGKTACYIEVNQSNYIENVTRLYSDAKVLADGKIKLGEILLYKFSNIIEALEENFNYYIKDYGSAINKDFELISFLEQDIRIVICGSKPNEIFAAQSILENRVYSDVSFIFSFVPKDEQDGIKEMMSSRKDKTYFAGLTPDPYSYNSGMNMVYKQIIA